MARVYEALKRVEAQRSEAVSVVPLQARPLRQADEAPRSLWNQWFFRGRARRFDSRVCPTDMILLDQLHTVTARIERLEGEAQRLQERLANMSDERTQLIETELRRLHALVEESANRGRTAVQRSMILLLAALVLLLVILLRI